MIPVNLKMLLEKQQYRIIGGHSAVKLCTWTKKSLRDEGVCYKQEFYGIQCHRCLQMTPSVASCPNRCVFCWRATDRTVSNDMEGSALDEPEDILDGAIKAQRELLTGFKGFEGTNMKKWKEAQDPDQVAISLSGEPTAYPRIDEFIDLCNRRGMTTFLVTNGQFPEHLKGMTEPYQMYLSLDAPTKDLYRKLDAPLFKDFWERFEKTVEIMSTMGCRKAVRLTLVKGWNMSHVKEYARMIERIDPRFIEVKAYMHVGFSKHRLERECMPMHQEVMDFSKLLEEELSYRITKENKSSRVVLLER